MLGDDHLKILLRNFLNKSFWEDIKYFFINKLVSLIKGYLSGNLIFAYWGKSQNNFGDLLTPLILKHYGLTPVHAVPNESHLVSVGTLLGYFSTDFKGVILGTGINEPTKKTFSSAKVIGLRGKLTQKVLGLENKNIILGDPGLLVSRIFPARMTKKWKLGIVPHMSELYHPIVNRWTKNLGDSAKIINPLRNPEIVITEISACENIISSSLHGLVVADSFCIPNIRFIIEDTYKFNYFRFEDYYSALGIPYDWINVDGTESLEILLMKLRKDFSMIEEIKENLDQMFRSFTQSYLSQTKSDR